MSEANIHWTSGPVLRARPSGPFVLREAVRVGERGLLGEVIRVARDEILVQIYEDPSGLRPGVQVQGTGQPLGVRLGPGLLGGIFDGLLRRLDDPALGPYVQPGQRDTAGGHFRFRPAVGVGKMLAAGMKVGAVENGTPLPQHCLMPPDLPPGEVVWIAPEGYYGEDEPLCRIRGSDGREWPVTLVQQWAVRVPRPVARRLPADEPLVTGQRTVDCLFPIARGSTAAIPGGFGTGKTILMETIAKWCSADIIVYVGCGERGNEMAGLLAEFRQLEDPRSGRPLLERSVIIANTSNMPVSAREASIYSGVTVAEFFRDQGLHVALMADSTSRWAEALREVSGRLGELPSEGGHPPYLSSRLAEFYERAASVQTLSGAIGSVTILGAVSPPSGDFSEPVTNHTRRYVDSLWMLDAHRAQARFYPAIHPLQSYSLAAASLARWWQGIGCAHWQELRRRFLTLLEEAARLERMARIIGKEAMPPRQRLVLLSAQLVNEGFLRQSAFSANDRYATPARQAAMMQLVGRFLDLAQQGLELGVTPETLAETPIFRHLMRMGEDIPEGDWEGFTTLDRAISTTLAGLAGVPSPQS